MTETSLTRYEDLPRNRDHALRLTLVKPGTYYDVVGSVKWCFDIQVTYNARGASTLQFKTYKDAPGADRLMEDYEIALHVRDPHRQRWIQPPNSRFVIQTWEEDLVDQTNVISFTAVQTVTLLDKVVLWPHAQQAQRNNRLDRAQEQHREALQDYESKAREFINAARRVAKGAGLPSGSGNFTPNPHAPDGYGASYKGRLYFARRGIPYVHRSILQRTGHMVADVRTGHIWWWSAKRRLWIRMRRDNGIKQEKRRDRNELVRLARRSSTARDRLLAVSRELERATRGARETSRDGTRYFYNSTPGRVLNVAWNEGVRRDTARGVRQPSGRINWRLKGLLRSWTNADYTRGGGWRNAHRQPHEFRVGTGLFTMIQDFQERGMLDWRVRGRTLELRPYGGFRVDQSSRVALRLGQDVEEAVTRGSLADHASNVLVTGEGSRAYNLVWSPSMKTNHTGWGFFEASMGDSEARSRSQARTATTAARGEMTRRRKVESSRKVVLDQNSAIPMIDYEPHHVISVYDYNGKQMNRRVESISLTMDDDGKLSAVIVLETRHQNAIVRFGSSISKTMGGVTHMQGHLPLDQSMPEREESELAKVLPAPPLTGLGASVRFDQLTGKPEVVIRATWDNDFSNDLPLLSEQEMEAVTLDEELDPADVPEEELEENDEPFDEETEGVLQP